jgi:hypothetical protein
MRGAMNLSRQTIRSSNRMGAARSVAHRSQRGHGYAAGRGVDRAADALRSVCR